MLIMLASFFYNQIHLRTSFLVGTVYMMIVLPAYEYRCSLLRRPKLQHAFPCTFDQSFHSLHWAPLAMPGFTDKHLLLKLGMSVIHNSIARYVRSTSAACCSSSQAEAVIPLFPCTGISSDDGPKLEMLHLP
jgi:hypothetical protein